MNYEIFLNKVIYFNKSVNKCQIYDLKYLTMLPDGFYEFKVINNTFYQIVKDKFIQIPILYQTEYEDEGKGHSPVFICKCDNYYVGQKTSKDSDGLKIEVKNNKFIASSKDDLHCVGKTNYETTKFTLNGVIDLFKQYKYLDRLLKLK